MALAFPLKLFKDYTRGFWQRQSPIEIQSKRLVRHLFGMVK
jgi:hypothetical protein